MAGVLRHWPGATVAAVSRVPLRGFQHFLNAYRGSWQGATGSTSVVLRRDEFPYVIRHGTSDFAVFCEVLLQEEYACIPHLDDVRTIVDAGANVGFSTRYLLRRFPSARVIALEPDF